MVHSYYQTANVLFLLFGLAVVVGHAIPRAVKGEVAVLVLLRPGRRIERPGLQQEHWGAARVEYNCFNSRDMAIAEVLKREAPEGHAFIAFGNNFSSTFAYLAERKSFTVPPWFDNATVLGHPQDFLGDSPLGGYRGVSHHEPWLRSRARIRTSLALARRIGSSPAWSRPVPR